MPFCFLKRKEELVAFQAFLFGLMGTGLILVGLGLYAAAVVVYTVVTH